MDFKLNAWVKNKRFMLFFKSERFTKKAGTAKASIMAVVLGVLLGIIIVCVYGYNGFNFFGKIFSSAFDTSFKVGSKTMLDQTMLYFSTYFLIGLGLGTTTGSWVANVWIYYLRSSYLYLVLEIQTLIVN
jgi:ABC-type uncharacterized transport system permease subunit